MNELILSNGPELEFVLPHHKAAFINNVIEIYTLNVEFLSMQKGMFPELTDIAQLINDQFLLGGTITRRLGNPDVYITDEAKITHNLVDRWAETMIKELNVYLNDMDIDYELLKQDVEKVLEYYRISYIRKKMLIINDKQCTFDIVHNLPITEVW